MMAYNPQTYNMYGHTMSHPWSQPAWACSTQPVSGIVGVTGIEGAKAYPLPPNSSMPLFDNNDDVLYVKTTDAAGYPTVKTFRFAPIEPIEAQGSPSGQVSRDEFDELVAKVDAIASKPTTRRKAAADGE